MSKSQPDSSALQRDQLVLRPVQLTELGRACTEPQGPLAFYKGLFAALKQEPIVEPKGHIAQTRVWRYLSAHTDSEDENMLDPSRHLKMLGSAGSQSLNLERAQCKPLPCGRVLRTSHCGLKPLKSLPLVP